MAKVTKLLDDIDGSEVDEDAGGGTLVFSVDSQFYTIDLSAKNRAAFDKALQKFVDAAEGIEPPYEETPARRPGRGAGRGSSAARAQGGATAQRDYLQRVREWGREQGYQISDRGRIAAEIQSAYDEAH